MATIRATFLGTGNFLAPGERYWNSFVLRNSDVCVLVEPSPTSLPNLRRAGVAVEELDAIVISHFHPDHTFGWPFLLLEIVRRPRDRPLYVVGPPGVEGFLADMMRFGSVTDIDAAARETRDLRYVEADPAAAPQKAGPLGFTAVTVDHVPELECFGYVLELGGRRIGYSGDTKPCDGLEALAESSEALVLECNGAHPAKTHMDAGAVMSVARRHPHLKLVVTHLGGDVKASMLAGIEVPDDFMSIELP